MTKKQYLEDMDIIDVHNAIYVSGMPKEIIDTIWTDGEIKPGDKDKLKEALENLRRKNNGV
jgi:hypothetical protein